MLVFIAFKQGKPLETDESAVKTIAKSLKIKEDHSKTIEKTMKTIANHGKGSENIGKPMKKQQNHCKNSGMSNGNHCKTIKKTIKKPLQTLERAMKSIAKSIHRTKGFHCFHRFPMVFLAFQLKAMKTSIRLTFLWGGRFPGNLPPHRKVTRMLVFIAFN